MKKLITAALIFASAAMYAGENPAPEPFCDCKGIGAVHKTYPELTYNNSGVRPQSSQKYQQIPFNQRIFLGFDFLWFYYLEIYK